MMSKKDYRVIAAGFARSHDRWLSHSQFVVEQTILEVADSLAEANPNFDRDTFYEECGVSKSSPIRREVVKINHE